TPGMALASTQSALIYVLAYMLTTLGAFAVVIAVEKADGTGVNLEDFIGLSKRRPLLAVAMAIFMLSLTGIPLTAGFIGKWFVFQVTLQAGLIPLAIIGVVTSVASAFYYVRVIVNMYLLDGDGREIDGDTQYTNWITYATLAGTLLLGIFPVLITNLTDTVALATAALP
ncbi:MAG TPA: proton-conducting transporter membrane subunit, partial [Aggregatilineales bacterium]|nr:proton-conducting transporter membrane subunit [Aggregatilineales bacterium]